ncbi:MAG: LysR family transcriptional regulator [Rhodospirillum sp.]|nr:LysR family transcriptional regulator [Rhodospirillum sp.]MCF8491198.1 LysR family transcriptional regulator [Rhodospirillum sp.]MCF8499606.1 LysR family transcriptional regulator [Rhodospirillum sp.]
MTRPDLNLLVTLDVLLAEGSVAGAARRLNLSPSAMSRALARLREVTGDPLLVRAGRGLVPTPRALDLRGRVGTLVDEAEAVLRPVEDLDPARLNRQFTLRNREGFVETFGAPLLARVAMDAPGVRLRFVTKPDRDSAPLRKGAVDLETGVVGSSLGPELRAQALFEDRYVGVVAPGHSLAEGPVTRERLGAARHVAVYRREGKRGPLDDALDAQGVTRDLAVIVSSFTEALALVRDTDLVACVPERCTLRPREGLVTFPLPVTAPGLVLSLLWHPRLDADPAHRWVRGLVRSVVKGCLSAPGTPG